MWIQRYRPAFVEGFKEQKQEFDTLKELVRIPWVRKWADNKYFHQFSIDSLPRKTVLMAELKDGSKWWVVGYITGEDQHMLDLPKWAPRKEGE